MKNETKKTVKIFCQAKGGVGKSFITYFKMLELKSKSVDAEVILLDSSQKADQNKDRLTKVFGKEKIHVLDIKNQNNELKRIQIYDVLQFASTLKSTNILIDFGASESTILGEALEYDKEFDVENFKYIASELNIMLEFNVLISGSSDNIKETIKYFELFSSIFSKDFKVIGLVNDYTFQADNDSGKLEDILKANHNVQVVGTSGNRSADTVYDIIKKIANSDISIEEAMSKNIASRFRINNMLKQLEAV